jgi:hypothetical protein
VLPCPEADKDPTAYDGPRAEGADILNGADPDPGMGRVCAGVVEKLAFYVYRLVDPRTRNTFYVGKAKGSRVFDHARLRFSAKRSRRTVRR